MKFEISVKRSGTYRTFRLNMKIVKTPFIWTFLDCKLLLLLCCIAGLNNLKSVEQVVLW